MTSLMQGVGGRGQNRAEYTLPAEMFWGEDFWLETGRLKKTEFFKIANSQNCFVKISWIR